MSAGASCYDLGAVTLQSGVVLQNARISFEAHGTLSPSRDNLVLFPTWFTGQHRDCEWIIGPNRALDPSRFCIVAVDILGNGASSSPSNQAAPHHGVRFPYVSLLDSVMLQRRVLREVFDVARIRLVLGRSMGAQIAFQWASYFPEEVDAMLAIEGSARTSPHNYAFLATMKMALQSDPDWAGGEYSQRPVLSVRRMRLVADSWGFSQEWYRRELFRQLGFENVQAFLSRDLPLPVADTNDYLAQIATWERADISNNLRFRKNLDAALRSISARSIVMPCETDLYFPPKDNVGEVSRMPKAELRVMPSVWGHRAGSPGTDPDDISFIERAIRDLLSEGEGR